MEGGGRTGRGGATLSLAELGSTLLAVAERARMGIIITELDRGAAGPVFLNQAAVDLFGYPRETLMREVNLLDHVVPDQRRRVDDLVARLESGEPVGSVVEAVLLQANGQRVPVSAHFVRIAHEDRVFTVNILTDLSERQHLQEQLARADRLAAMGTLAAGVAHEINNPLAFTRLNTDILRRLIENDMPDGEPRARALALLDEVRAGTDRVASIIRDLGTFSRAEEGEVGPVSLSDSVADAARLVMHEIRHRARLVVDVPADLPPVHASALRLEQVFVNLLLNAAQAFSVQSERNEIRVRGGVLPGGALHVDVEDNGPGIPPDIAGRIFDPFFTTKAVGVGVGLGLPICHGIVSSLGGELTFASAPGQGARFRVALPVGGRSATAPAHPPAVPAPAAVRVRGRILIVDDELAIGRSIKSLLDDDHEVDIVGSGEDALAVLLGGARTYDVVLCDLSMRGMSGADLFERIAAERPGLEQRFVLMTGGAVTERARGFLARVPNRRLDKPFSVDALEAAVRDALAARPP
ncbi:MAG TPA: ATP-binding protein [Kofleriaceae bacterium]|nr:ATP-binding protein [Kofleriaceae bacterium]